MEKQFPVFFRIMNRGFVWRYFQNNSAISNIVSFDQNISLDDKSASWSL